MSDQVTAAAARPAASVLPPVTLVLGGARSGKSRHAEGLIAAASHEAVYFATGAACDDEMAERIRRHRDRRLGASTRWHTVEEPIELAGRLKDLARPDRPILVDCLTLWLSNLLFAGHDITSAANRLVDVLPALAGPVVLVANEVGWGIVPENALARRFRDEAGLVNQAVARIADRVVLIAAGLPLTLKSPAL